METETTTMPEWAVKHFKRPVPKDWKPAIQRHALHMKVLAVATTRVEGMWSAYISNVPGYHHDVEYHGVLEFGDKLGQKIAEALFPEFKGIPYAR